MGQGQNGQWAKMFQQAVQQIKSIVQRQNPPQNDKFKGLTSCAITQRGLAAAYQKVTKTKRKQDAIVYTSLASGFPQGLNQAQLSKLLNSNFISYCFDNPPDHWMTFVYDSKNEVWILVQSWEEKFSLEQWISFPLLTIAKQVKEHLIKNGQLADPIYNLSNFSKCFWLSWLKQVNIAQKNPDIMKRLEATDKYFKNFFEMTAEQYHIGRFIQGIQYFEKN